MSVRRLKAGNDSRTELTRSRFRWFWWNAPIGREKSTKVKVKNFHLSKRLNLNEVGC